MSTQYDDLDDMHEKGRRSMVAAAILYVATIVIGVSGFIAALHGNNLWVVILWAVGCVTALLCIFAFRASYVWHTVADRMREARKL